MEPEGPFRPGGLQRSAPSVCGAEGWCALHDSHPFAPSGSALPSCSPTSDRRQTLGWSRWNGLRFPVEAPTEFLECGQLVSDQFDRDCAAQTGITRTKNLCPCLRGPVRLELIGTDSRSRTEIPLHEHVGHPVREKPTTLMREPATDFLPTKDGFSPAPARRGGWPETVVALVARELEHPLAGHLERNHQRPRARPDGRVVEGDVVLERVLRHSPELLDGVQLVARAHSSGVGHVVGRIHDQRVASHRARESPWIADRRRMCGAPQSGRCARRESSRCAARRRPGLG